jgi:hypothetical protein
MQPLREKGEVKTSILGSHILYRAKEEDNVAESVEGLRLGQVEFEVSENYPREDVSTSSLECGYAVQERALLDKRHQL